MFQGIIDWTNNEPRNKSEFSTSDNENPQNEESEKVDLKPEDIERLEKLKECENVPLQTENRPLSNMGQSWKSEEIRQTKL